ncbi:FtsW/RodA/SpoVE family cell cycle protein [Paenibacillus lautus]|uniref:FtsW/RodA/SpoVE family cell cycle protein n=1 Tax=Paenibacillus lautus TaxID=1401 RepID=UPI002DBA0470|nr:FtsW/RodA/SpoVE family cell cycle protein [Paenibacillus lautus]MEC0254347.1 FtsW/RodA/SpoVE family cell cycle protein [Paenibacillus lautus]
MRPVEEYKVVQDFLARVCKQVRARAMHPEIREELLGHIEERTELLMLEGNAEEPAVQEAVKQMGDPGDIGKSLHMAHRPQLDWKLLVLLALLSMIGLFGALSVDYSGTEVVSDFFVRKAAFFGIGVILLVGLYFLDYRKLKRCSGVLFFITLCLMAFTLIRGVDVNGLTIFLDFGPIMIPMLGVASVFLLLIALSGMKPASQWGLWESVFHILYRGVLPIILYSLSGSMVYLFIYLLGFLVLTWTTKRNIKQFAVLTLLPFFGLAYILFTKRLYLMWRLEGLADREGGGGYFMRVIADAVSSAGWFGQGFAAPNPGIPYVYSDSIYPYLIYCFGWLFGIVVGMVVLLFFARVWSISNVLHDSYGKNIVTGVIVVMGLRLLMPILMGLGVVPVISLDFPFISYGGVNNMLDFAIVGLLLSIYRRKNMIPRGVGEAAPMKVA